MTGLSPELWLSSPGLQVGYTYKQAPIVQAVLALGTVNRGGLSVEQFLELRPEGFEPHELLDVAGEFSLVDGAVVGSTQSDVAGYVFTTASQLESIQARLTEYAYVQRYPYPGWEQFSHSAETHWNWYRRVAGTDEVRQVAARFTNEIPMPRSVEIKDYLRTSVDVSPYLPQSVSSMFLQVDVPIPVVGAVATITSSLLTQSARGPVPALLLDVDVKMEIALDANSPEFDKTLREILETLRQTKNYVFEACITDATRGLIDRNVVD